MTTVRLPPSRSPFPPPFQHPARGRIQPEQGHSSCHSRSAIHTTWHTHQRADSSSLRTGYCNGCHPRHATVPRQTLEHQGASSFVLRHDLYASLVARRTFHMTHNRPIPLPTSCSLQHPQRPQAQGPRTATPNQSPASYLTSSSTSATTTTTTTAITITNTTGQPKTPKRHHPEKLLHRPASCQGGPPTTLPPAQLYSPRSRLSLLPPWLPSCSILVSEHAVPVF